jgi:hypothetical protein
VARALSLGQQCGLDLPGDRGVGVLQHVGQRVGPALVQLPSGQRDERQGQLRDPGAGAAVPVLGRTPAQVEDRGQFGGEELTHPAIAGIHRPPGPAGTRNTRSRVVSRRPHAGQLPDDLSLPGGVPGPPPLDGPQLGGQPIVAGGRGLRRMPTTDEEDVDLPPRRAGRHRRSGQLRRRGHGSNIRSRYDSSGHGGTVGKKDFGRPRSPRAHGQDPRTCRRRRRPPRATATSPGRRRRRTRGRPATNGASCGATA